MKLKNMFSVKMYLQGLKKIRGAGIATAITVIVTNALIPIIALIEELTRTYEADYYSYGSDFISTRTVSEVEFWQLAPCALLIMLFAPMATFAMFSYLNERSKSDFYHSLPQRRECVAISFVSAVLTWTVGTVAVSTVLNFILWNIVPYQSASFTTLLVCLLVYVTLTLLFVGGMFLAMSITGTTVANFLIFVLLMLFLRIIGAMFIWGVDEMSNVFIAEYSPLRWLSFDYFLPYGLLMDLFGGEGNAYANIPLIIYTLAVSLAAIVLAVVCYCRRRSESAGRSAPSKKLQHVYRFAVTFPFVVILAQMIIEDGLDGYHLVLFALALLVYLLFELITTKKAKSMLKALPLFAVPLALGVAYMAGVWGTAQAIDGVMPSSDEISGVSILEDRYGSSYEELIIGDVTTDSPQAAAIISDALEKTVKGNFRYDGISYRYIDVKIEIKGGRTVYRRVRMPDTDYYKLIEIMESSEKNDGKYLRLPSDDDITNIYVSGAGIFTSDAKELWNSFKEEYALLDDAQKKIIKDYATGRGHDYSYGMEKVEVEIVDDKMTYISPEQFSYENYVWIEINGRYGLTYFHSSYPIIPELMPKTAQRYYQLYAETQHSSGQEFAFFEASSRIDVCQLPELKGAYYDYSVNLVPVLLDKKPLGFGFTSAGSVGDAETKLERYRGIINAVETCENPFELDDINNIYKLSIHVDGLVIDGQQTFEYKGEKGTQYVTEYYDKNDPLYMRYEFYVSLSDAEYQAISALFAAENGAK